MVTLTLTLLSAERGPQSQYPSPKNLHLSLIVGDQRCDVDDDWFEDGVLRSTRRSRRRRKAGLLRDLRESTAVTGPKHLVSWSTSITTGLTGTRLASSGALAAAAASPVSPADAQVRCWPIAPAAA
jgi:hypothetical protein